MKKITTAFFSLLGVTAFFSCKNKINLATAENGKSLLWEISGKELKKPSYFLGTMHLMCEEDAALSENVKTLITIVDQVYLEVDMDNASELLSGILDLQKDRAETLESVLSGEDYNKVKSFFQNLQPSVPFSILEKQPPLMLSSSVYELLLPCEQKNGVEMKIIDEAYKHKKETKGLETIAFQAGIFDSIPFKEQADELVKSIENLDKGRASMEQMMKVYKSQDVEELYNLSTSEDSSIISHIDLLLFKRNRNWINQFPIIAKDKVTLFAVGAGHLGGEQGVLNLLKKQGYTIRPVEN